jgi:hypothetical protein
MAWNFQAVDMYYILVNRRCTLVNCSWWKMKVHDSDGSRGPSQRRAMHVTPPDSQARKNGSPGMWDVYPSYHWASARIADNRGVEGIFCGGPERAVDVGEAMDETMRK